MFKHPLRSGVGLAAVAALALAGCSPAGGGGTTTTSAPATTTSAPATSAPAADVPSSPAAAVDLIAPGTLTICTNPPFDPMELVDSQGKVVGFDLDMLGLVADELGVTSTVIQTDFAQITAGAVFAAGRCDIAASSITITEARRGAVLFSNPYFSATQALAVMADSGITDLSGLSGKTVSVQSDTTGADYANEHAGEYGFQVMVFDDAGTALNALLSGRAQAVLVDRAIVYKFVADNPTTKVATEFQTGETYGIAAKVNDANASALMAVVNQVLVNAQADGRLLSIYQKWVDPAATEFTLPPA